MNKLVYLFELDSVRNSCDEIKCAQKAMFEEIVHNGNKIVLSFNQLTDSAGFLSMLLNDDTYNSLMELINCGVIKVSLFGEYRTPSQYIQGAIKKCVKNKEGFIFSGLPVLSSEATTLKYIKNALKYNDIKRFEELKNKECGEDKCEKLEFLYRYVKLILRMSWNAVASNPPKDGKSKNFIEFMDVLLDQNKLVGYRDNIIVSNMDYYKKALLLLSDIRKRFQDSKEKINQRSEWVNALNGDDDDVCIANAIIDLCYNYTIEDSISGVSKHYNEDDEDDFFEDYCCRFNEYWEQRKIGKEGIHTFPTKDEKIRIPCVDSGVSWESAIRIIRTVYPPEKTDKVITTCKSGEIYEYNYDKEKNQWKKMMNRCRKRFYYTAFGYIVAFFAIELLMGALEDIFAATGLFAGVFFNIVSVALFCFVSVGVSWIVKKILKKDCPDLVESLRDVKNGIKDGYLIKKAPEGISYKRL